jgi:DNA-binding NarL/FixJ family response regulator
MNTNHSIKNIVIADSQFLIVEGLRSLLGNDERFFIAGIVNTQSGLYKVLGNNFCHLLITDMAMLDYNAVDDLKSIKEKFPQLAVLLLSDCTSKAEFTELTRIGIKNILYKTADRDEILAAIDAAIKGKKYFAGEILDMLMETEETKLFPEEPAHLTCSEIEVVRLIANGLTTKEIALQKNISFHTVNTHRKNIFRKMQVSNASELIMHAIRAGWIDNIEYYI